MKWFIDDILYKTLNNNKPGPIVPTPVTFPTVPHYIILDQAMWPYAIGNPKNFPKYFEIDYIRVYEWKDENSE